MWRNVEVMRNQNEGKKWFIKMMGKLKRTKGEGLAGLHSHEKTERSQ